MENVHDTDYAYSGPVAGLPALFGRALAGHSAVRA